MQQNDVLKVTIETIASGGEGIARADGMTIFVEEGVPGDELDIKITQLRKNYCKASINKVIKPSPDRTDPPCKYFHECGACQLQHIKYEAQLKYKKKIVRDAVSRIGGLSAEIVSDIIRAENTFGYRNKLQYPVRESKALNPNSQTNPKSKFSNVQMGYFRMGTHDVVDIDECIVLHPFLNKLASKVKKLVGDYDIPIYEEDSGRGLLRHVLARVGFNTNEALLALVINGDELKGSKNFAKSLVEDLIKDHVQNDVKLNSISINSNTRQTNVILGENTRTVWGKDFIKENLGGLMFNISATSFFQVNPYQAVKLFDTGLKAASFTGKESVVDVYCGTGSISLWISNFVKEVYGIEEIRSAVSDANTNAKINNINNAFFKCGTAEKLLQQLIDTGHKPDVIILDPPRSGCSEKVLDSVIKLLPKKVIYVSCDPATLARDSKIVSAKYSVKSVQPVDMFPQTAHIECVALLEKS